MKNKQRLTGTATAICFLVLIIDSRTALEGARSGVDLCLKTVIPSLFPFFVLSILLTSTMEGTDSPVLTALAALFRVPSAAASVLVPAFLGGYPVGAQCVSNLYHRKQIDRNTAHRLLAFCNNAGPSFLFGMVSGFFPEGWMTWLLWGIHIVSAALIAAVLPIRESAENIHTEQSRTSRPQIILVSAKAMTSVCGWVILFRTLIAFLKKWFLWILPAPCQVLIIGFLELANGCCELAAISDVAVRFVVCSCMLAFGGGCVLLQTASVINGLSLRFYIFGKVLQMVFSFLLSGIFVLKKGVLLAIFLPALFFLLRKVQNRYSNPNVIPV